MKTLPTKTVIAALASLTALSTGLLLAACGDARHAAGEEGGSGPTAGAKPASSSASRAGAAGAEGATGTAGAASNPCTPTGADDPDDTFTDDNCDGIDGDQSKAIFVAPSGNDSATGTMQQPVQSIGKAIELASAAKKAVYVCNATYSESISVTGTAVRIYGGYDCANGWARTNAARAEIASPSSRALTITEVTGKMVIDRVNFQSSSATEAAGSSIAALVVGSKDVTFSHADFTAGDGAPGVRGEAVPAVYTYAAGELDVRKGQPGMSVPAVLYDLTSSSPYIYYGLGGIMGGGPGYQPPKCLANNALTWGGTGGDGGNVETGRSNGAGLAGNPAGPVGGGNGQSGSDSAPGVPAGLGFGSVDSNGYSPTNRGADGDPGGMGQAGGGGDGLASYVVSFVSGDIIGTTNYYVVGGGGGSGGSAGCGGWGGKGGGGGGASIALLIVDSSVSLSWGAYKTGKGGPGALGSAGGLGADGAPGGAGGWSSCDCTPAVTPGCGTSVCPKKQAQAGGAGGKGGKGGAGGPGGGGPSIPLVVSGPEPTSYALTFDPGPGGAGADSGQGAKGASGESTDSKVVSSPSVNTPDAGTE
jgi:hypothetical protein